MTVVFDAETQRLELDQEAFDCLVAWSRGDTDVGTQLVNLEAAGVINHQSPHPAVVDRLEAIAEHVCQLQLNFVNDEGTYKSGDGWVSADAATLLVDLSDGQRDLQEVPPTLLPAAIARLCRVEPGVRLDAEPLPLKHLEFDGLLAPSSVRRRRIADRLDTYVTNPEMADVIECLVTGPWRCWSATLAWRTPQGDPVGYGLQVLATDAGLCQCHVDDQQVVLRPTTPTEIWRRLTMLLPDEVEER